PIKFLPANSRASSLIIAEGVLYTTTTDCSGKAGAVWSVDLNGETRHVNSFTLKAGSATGPGGLAIGTSGTVYATGQGTLYALSPKDLGMKQSFSAGAAVPVVFSYKEREMVVAPDANGRLCLLDGKRLADPLSCTNAVGAVSGGLSSWQDPDGTRWVLAPVWGPENSGTPAGSVVAFRLEDQSGKPVLTQAWASRGMNAPQPPVITSGVVFALAAGDKTHAILYALDAMTGQEIYSTGDQVGSAANRNGVTLANGRVYFTTVDSTLYAFGIRLEI
ncbi:MAG: PQQ-binding-like beta-propeller repeat protein, partial [Acidobacteriota bacterium]|nr:PQQ-binding-like beta-propeller repeat protein [Acidobacteriota bacterium]